MHHSRVYATFQKTVTLTRCSLTFENQNQKKLTINLTITTTTTTATKSTTITTLIKHRTNQTWHTLLNQYLRTMSTAASIICVISCIFRCVWCRCAFSSSSRSSFSVPFSSCSDIFETNQRRTPTTSSD